MTNFKGTNTLRSPLESFYYRGLYKQDAFRGGGIFNPEVLDFSFAENVLYGRVNTVLNTVYPIENRMKVISSDSDAASSYRVVNFVKDAFEVVRSTMSSARDQGTIPSDQSFFSKIEIKRAYTSPIELYNDYIDELMERYTTEYLIEKNNKRHVMTLSNFIDHFIIFLHNQASHTPFTLTSFQRSTKSNIFTSGLAIDIGGLDFGFDPDIERSVLRNPCFQFYLKVCRANGFLVSQLAPTLMVADVLSPGLLPYAQRNEVYTTETVFTKNYREAFLDDYDLMQIKLIDAFNLFVGLFPIEKIIMPKCKKTTFSTIKERTITNMSTAQKQISMNRWFLYYAKIRNIEEEGALDKQAYKILAKNIKTTKYLDKVQGIRYINSVFRNTYKKKYGGVNYFVRKDEANRSDRIPSVERVSGVDPTSDVIGPSDISSFVGTSGGSSGGSSGGY